MSVWSDNIAILVDEAGGQNEFAYAVKVSQGTVSRWGKGTIPRDLEAVERVANYANVAPDQIMRVPLRAARAGTSFSSPQVSLMMPVQLPSEDRLTTMMRGLLKSVGLSDQDAGKHAGTLAQRLPDALAQAASPLASLPIDEESDPVSPPPRRAKPDREKRQ